MVLCPNNVGAATLKVEMANEVRAVHTVEESTLLHPKSSPTFTMNRGKASATTIPRANATKVKVADSHTQVFQILEQGV